MPGFARKLTAEELEGLVDLVLKLGVDEPRKPRLEQPS
jgi:hypothetical protein